MIGSRKLQLAIAAALVIMMILVALTGRPGTVEGNHAWLHEDGVGYDGIGPDYGWVNVHIIPSSTSRYSEALAAVDNWRALRHGEIWWLRHTDNAAEAQAEVIDRDTATVFGGTHLFICNTYFVYDPAHPRRAAAYATTIMTDAAGDLRGMDGDGFWAKRPGVPFWHATACLNSAKNNDMGTIAHELRHALGLDHPTVSNEDTFGTCDDTGVDTIMAYNYLP